MQRESRCWCVAAQLHKMQSWSSVVCFGSAQCSHQELGGLGYMVNAELNLQMWIIISILSCLPKLEKLLLMRNMLCEVWRGFFQWKRRIPQLKRSLIHPCSPLFSQKSGINIVSLLWLLLPAIVFPWIPVQGRTETQPACCFFPPTIILARQWPCCLPDCPSCSLKDHPAARFQGGGMQVQPGAIPSSQLIFFLK